MAKGSNKKRRAKRTALHEAALLQEVAVVPNAPSLAFPAQLLYQQLRSLPAAQLPVGPAHGDERDPLRPSKTVIGFDVGKRIEFGPYGTSQREFVLDNLVTLLTGQLYPHVAGVQFTPSWEQRSSRTARFFLMAHDGYSAFRAFQSLRRLNNIFLRITPTGLVLPPSPADEDGFFWGLTKHPVVMYSPAPQPIAPAHPDDTVVVLYTLDSPALPDPDTVTIKFRHLPLQLVTKGVANLFLQAAGYSETDFTVLDEYQPELMVHGRSTSASPFGGPTLLGNYFATVKPSSSLPNLLSNVTGTWHVPGATQPVRINVVPHSVRKVAGCPPVSVPAPILLHTQLPLPQPSPQPLTSPEPTATQQQLMGFAARAGLQQRTMLIPSMQHAPTAIAQPPPALHTVRHQAGPPSVSPPDRSRTLAAGSASTSGDFDDPDDDFYADLLRHVAAAHLHSHVDALNESEDEDPASLMREAEEQLAFHADYADACLDLFEDDF